jgi:hypothetical protein
LRSLFADDMKQLVKRLIERSLLSSLQLCDILRQRQSAQASNISDVLKSFFGALLRVCDGQFAPLFHQTLVKQLILPRAQMFHVMQHYRAQVGLQSHTPETVSALFQDIGEVMSIEQEIGALVGIKTRSMNKLLASIRQSQLQSLLEVASSETEQPRLRQTVQTVVYELFAKLLNASASLVKSADQSSLGIELALLRDHNCASACIHLRTMLGPQAVADAVSVAWSTFVEECLFRVLTTSSDGNQLVKSLIAMWQLFQIMLRLMFPVEQLFAVVNQSDCALSQMRASQLSVAVGDSWMKAWQRLQKVDMHQRSEAFAFAIDLHLRGSTVLTLNFPFSALSADASSSSSSSSSSAAQADPFGCVDWLGLYESLSGFSVGSIVPVQLLAEVINLLMTGGLKADATQKIEKSSPELQSHFTLIFSRLMVQRLIERCTEASKELLVVSLLSIHGVAQYADIF